MRSIKLPKWLKRTVLSIAGFAVAMTALIGFAHTAAGRPLRPLLSFMHKHGVTGGASCPLGYDVATSPEAREAGRRKFAANHPSDAIASARPALGFTLDKTTKDDVMAWSQSHSANCSHAKAANGPDLECADVDASAFNDGGMAKRTLWFNFGQDGTLISLVVIGKDPSAETVSATFASRENAIDAAAGPAVSKDRDASAAYLSRGLLMQVSAEYRFKNYYSVLRATNMGSSGYMLTEEYRSLPTG